MPEPCRAARSPGGGIVRFRRLGHLFLRNIAQPAEILEPFLGQFLDAPFKLGMAAQKIR